ncbi:C2 domain-containing protein 3 [Entophlyctis sp. JEL0112]|nr:C2 domain-containing protein 3 [Entophlyctis sp. JEL0112]
MHRSSASKAATRPLAASRRVVAAPAPSVSGDADAGPNAASDKPAAANEEPGASATTRQLSAILPLPSLPPYVNVDAAPRFFLRVAMPKLVWRAPSSPNKRANATRSAKLKQAKVLLHWWGYDASAPCLFHPPCVDSRSKHPIPPAKTKQQSQEGSLLQQHTMKFPVKCSKPNLLAYLRDMGPLVLAVHAADVGEVGRFKIPDLSMVAGEPYSKPLNGWFPIMAPDTSITASKGSLVQIGEINFSCFLENAPGQSSFDVDEANRRSFVTSREVVTPIPPAAYDGTEDPVPISVENISQRMESSDELDDILHNEYKKSSSKGSKPTSRTVIFNVENVESDPNDNILGNITTNESIHNSSNDALQSQTDPKYRDGDSFEGRSFVSSNHYANESMYDFPASPPQMSEKPEPSDMLGGAEGKNEKAISFSGGKILCQRPISSNSSFAAVYKRALKLKEEISVAVGTVVESFDELEGQRTEDKSIRDQLGSDIFGFSDPDFKRNIPLARAFDSILDEIRDEESIFNGYISSSSDSLHSENSQSSFDDDDLIIEALNAQFDDAIIREDFVDIKNGSRSRKFDDDMVSDLLNRNKSEKKLSKPNVPSFPMDSVAVLDHRQLPAPQMLTPDILTALGRVHSIRVHINRMEIKSSSLPLFMTSFVIDYAIRSSSESVVPELIDEVPLKISSRLVSSNLPFTIPGKTKGNANSTVTIDKQEIHPIIFDGAAAELWMQSSIYFNATATQSPSKSTASATQTVRPPVKRPKVSTVAKKLMWEAYGSWKCREVLSTLDFYWAGRVPLFVDPNQPSNNAKGSTESFARHVGDLVVTVEMITTNRSYSARAPEKAHKAGIKLQQEIKPSSEEHVEIQDSPLPTSSLALPPHYVYLSVTTARSLALFPSASTSTETGSTLLFLSVRLFNSASVNTTPPLPYLPPFDMRTGEMNPPFTFDYAVTIPMAITAQFLQSSRELPLIVEVWSISPAYPSSRTRFTTTSSGEEPMAGVDPIYDSTSEFGDDDGKHLLGLIKIPFGYLVSTLADVCLNSRKVEAGDGKVNTDGVNLICASDKPILLPETEYAIIDPFSGISKGWVDNTIQITKTQKLERKVDKEVVQPRHSDTSKLLVSEGVRVVEELPQSTMEIGTKQQPPDRQEHSEIIENADTVIQICLHSACGLRSLLQDLITNRENAEAGEGSLNDIQAKTGNFVFVIVFVYLLRVVDVALSLGPNSYVSLRLFPPEIAKLSISRRKASVVTATVYRSFCPKYDFKSNITLDVVDSELLRWIQKGGRAVGEIWHQASQNEEEVILGKFEIPLGKLIDRPNGIQEEWMPVWSSSKRSSGDIISSAAVKVSMQFKNGMEYAEFEDASALTSNLNSRWACCLGVDIFELDIGGDMASLLENTCLLCVRWKYPVFDGDELVTAWNSTDISSKVRNSNGTLHASVGSRQSVTIDLSPAMLSFLRTNKLVFQVVSETKEKSLSVIGCAYVDIWDSVMAMRKAFRKNNMTETSIVSGTFAIVDASSADLGQSKLKVSIELGFVNKLLGNESFGFSTKGDAFPSIIPAIPEQSDQLLKPSDLGASVREIRLKIHVERAIQLSLISGEVINSFISFFWPFSSGTFASLVYPNSNTPHWKFQSTVTVPRNEQNLGKLRTADSHLELIVWHCPTASSNLPEFKNCTQIGVSRIDLGPLFTGCASVSGWYQIQRDGEPAGQVLVTVEPSENLGSCLMEIAAPSYEEFDFSELQSAAPEPSTLEEVGRRLYSNSESVESAKKVETKENISSNDKDLKMTSPNISRCCILQEEQYLAPPHPSVSDEQQVAEINLESDSGMVPMEIHSLNQVLPNEKQDEMSELSRSLQRTLDELDALQNAIRKRGELSDLNAETSVSPVDELYDHYLSISGEQLVAVTAADTQLQTLKIEDLDFRDFLDHEAFENSGGSQKSVQICPDAIASIVEPAPVSFPNDANRPLIGSKASVTKSVSDFNSPKDKDKAPASQTPIRDSSSENMECYSVSPRSPTSSKFSSVEDHLEGHLQDSGGGYRGLASSFKWRNTLAEMRLKADSYATTLDSPRAKRVLTRWNVKEGGNAVRARGARHENLDVADDNDSTSSSSDFDLALLRAQQTAFNTVSKLDGNAPVSGLRSLSVQRSAVRNFSDRVESAKRELPTHLTHLEHHDNSSDDDMEDDDYDTDFSLIFAKAKKNSANTPKSEDSPNLKSVLNASHARKRDTIHNEEEEIQQILERSRKARAEALRKVDLMKHGTGHIDKSFAEPKPAN